MSPSVQVRIANHDGGPTVLGQFIRAGILDQVRLQVCVCILRFGTWPRVHPRPMPVCLFVHLFNIRGLGSILAGILDQLRIWTDLDDARLNNFRTAAPPGSEPQIPTQLHLTLCGGKSLLECVRDCKGLQEEEKQLILREFDERVEMLDLPQCGEGASFKGFDIVQLLEPCGAQGETLQCVDAPVTVAVLAPRLQGSSE